MKWGKIVLSPFPFTDLAGRKTRPALVVSRSNQSGSDVILAFITTYSGEKLYGADLLIDQMHPDFAATGLRRSSVVKLDKLVTVNASLLLGELGELSTLLIRRRMISCVTLWSFLDQMLYY